MGRPKKTIDDEGEAGNGEVQHVLDELGVVTEAQLGMIQGCSPRAMKNRPQADLPPYFKAGGKRLFFKDDVVKFYRNRRNR